ncbi:hypothetical protein [Halomonas sp. CKK8]|uniref:hypothetical protein n=1 Tax=Halomonas sp. CKK8 TaxID=3036127 RepID=UPI0024154540|nr:hypothetical protein [Halomonas sp. CKK8]WFM72513.1 hypothetical protein P8934_05800 [Halomonas sp. CKK8]
MRRLSRLAKNPLFVLSFLVLVAALIAMLFGFSISGLFLELCGVSITIRSIIFTRDYFGAKGLIKIVKERLLELNELLFSLEEKGQHKSLSSAKTHESAGIVIPIRQVVIHNVEETSLMTLREDVKKLSENQRVIMDMAKEDSERLQREIKKIRSLSEKASKDIEQTFIDLHVEGSEFSFVGVLLVFLGAVMGIFA